MAWNKPARLGGPQSTWLSRLETDSKDYQAIALKKEHCRTHGNAQRDNQSTIDVAPSALHLSICSLQLDCVAYDLNRYALEHRQTQITLGNASDGCSTNTDLGGHLSVLLLVFTCFFGSLSLVFLFFHFFRKKSITLEPINIFQSYFVDLCQIISSTTWPNFKEKYRILAAISQNV